MDDRTRVLLVDDDANVANLTATYLQRVDERLTTAVETSPGRALDRLEDERIDCVVSDYDMPEMNGLSFLEAVREFDPDLPFILFTGKGSEEIASEAISAGVTDYLQKETGTDHYEVLANRVKNAVAQYRAEREAERANEQVRHTLERITDAFFALDDDWRFRYVNERAADLLDSDPEELVGEDIREAFPQTTGSDFHEAYRRAFETQQPTTVESEMTVTPGRWIESRAYPSEDGLSVYGRDVTERKQMEDELRETKEKIEALYDVAAEAISCSTHDEIYDLAVEAAEDILEFDFCGVDAVRDGELVRRAVSDEVPSDGYYETVSVNAEDNLAAWVYRTGESSLVRDVQAEGFTPAESGYRSALTVPLGEFGVFQAVSTDPDGFDEDDRELTELLAAHLTEALRRIDSGRALRAERDRFAALFENVPNAVVSCVYDDDQPIVQAVNPAFEDIFGWEHDEIVGEVLDEYIVPSDRHGEADALNDQIRNESRIDGAEVRRRTTDGVEDFLLNTGPVREDGDVEDVSVYTEITDQKERERKLARQNERLDEFASVVSHDLRNPLNVATGRLELLSEECESRHVPPLAESLERMDALIENLLALARQEQQPSETERVELTAVAEAAWATAETGDADLRIAGDATVRADPERVRQLLENLFRNSVDHADGPVTVRVGPLDSADDSAESGAGFYVADDGPGIPADERDRVLDHGFTTDQSGTGLGLAIVENVAEAHGWSVEVTESEEGGARFEFRT